MVSIWSKADAQKSLNPALPMSGIGKSGHKLRQSTFSINDPLSPADLIQCFNHPLAMPCLHFDISDLLEESIPDSDFEGLIEQAFLVGQIEGETMELTIIWIRNFCAKLTLQGLTNNSFLPYIGRTEFPENT